MRPLQLRVAGFTSFRDEQTIDFADLDLFAITGPTGSGKSSILDAMTYVLYGKAERVMDRVRQLVSQGQPSARVELTFDVDGHTYRVTRLTRAAGGAASTLLQREEADGSFIQYGPGADRVREVETAISELIGLDYTGFTRSVVLPQGQFHRFLAGEARERRTILTDLLGLGLYERMAAMAHQQAVGAEGNAANMEGLIESEFADVSDDAIKRASADEKVAAAALASVSEARAKVAAVVERVRATEREAAELEALGDDAAGLGERAGQIGERVVVLVGQLTEARRLAAEQAATVTSLSSASQEAAARAADTEATGGTLATIDNALGQLREAAGFEAAAESNRAEAKRLAGGVPAREQAVEAAETALEAARKRRTAATEAREAAETERVAMQTAHRVAALVADHSVGDPCPVCGRKLAALPAAPGADELRATEQRLAQAAADLRSEEAKVSEAESALRDAQAEVEKASTNVTMLAAQEATAKQRASELVEHVRAQAKLGPKVDAQKTLATRRQALVDAQNAATAAGVALAVAERELTRREGAVEVAGASLKGQRDALAALGTSALAARAKAKLGAEVRWPDLSADTAADELAAAAITIAATAGELADKARAGLADRASLLDRALAEARKLVEPFGLQGDSVGELAEAAEATGQEARSTVDALRLTIRSLTERLVRKAKLVESVAANRERARIMRTLAQALRSDHLVAFVQREALERLAVAASDHLRNLSADRYRLVCNDDEFEVIDTWNGDEKRNVRTLSGGETFLASLSLALALAEQLSALAVGGHARLDSLFLDEGFGSLDPETLETVTSAVEALREGGRLVGIITHIGELAERMPVRFVVHKSPRGSRVVREGPVTASVGLAENRSAP